MVNMHDTFCFMSFVAHFGYYLTESFLSRLLIYDPFYIGQLESGRLFTVAVVVCGRVDLLIANH